MNLLLGLKNGDMSCFDAIYASSKKPVFYSIYLVVKSKDIAEDLMQEVYVDLLEKKHKISDSVDIVAYLVTSAKNKAINYYNRHKREVEYASRLQDYSYTNDTSLDVGLLDLVKKTLNPKECEVFLLKVLGEYSFKEISKMTKTPIGTLTWQYQECRKKLQKVLGGIK